MRGLWQVPTLKATSSTSTHTNSFHWNGSYQGQRGLESLGEEVGTLCSASSCQPWTGASIHAYSLLISGCFLTLILLLQCTFAVNVEAAANCACPKSVRKGHPFICFIGTCLLEPFIVWRVFSFFLLVAWAFVRGTKIVVLCICNC